jgi:hypothetical protein
MKPPFSYGFRIVFPWYLHSLTIPGGIPISTKAFFQGPAEQHMRRASAMELERELSLAIDTPI